MKTVVILIAILTLTGCKETLHHYKEIIDRIDRIDVHYEDTHKSRTLSRREMQSFKKILIRDIRPRTQTKFKSDVIVGLYVGNNRIAFLEVRLSNNKPSANFNSNELNFGFRLTYGFGMFLDGLKSKMPNR